MPPAVMCSTFPKSGTGLLNQMLTAVLRPMKRISSFNGFGWGNVRWPHSQVLNRIKDTPDNYYLSDHLACDQPIVEEMQHWEVPMVFLYRDPRDVVVSTVYHIESSGALVLFPDKPHFWRMPSHEERMKRIILGSGELPALRWRWEQYAGWLDVDGVLCFLREVAISANEFRLVASVTYRSSGLATGSYGRCNSACNVDHI